MDIPKDKKEEKEKKAKAKAPSAFWMRYYRSLVIFAFLAVALTGWFVVVGPMFNEYQSIDVATKKAEYDEYRSVLDRFQKILTDWDAISREDKDRLNYFLPSDKDIPELITMISDMAEQSGFVVTMVTLTEVEQPVIDRTNVFPLVVSMSLEGGNYASLKNFTTKVESNLRLIDVASLNFQSNIGTYILNLNTYYLKENNLVK